MQHLKKLIQRFDNKGHPIEQCIDVLDMIEYAISYPTCTTIPESGLRLIEQRAAQIAHELEAMNPLLANRVRK